MCLQLITTWKVKKRICDSASVAHALPIVRSLHITKGLAKQAKTSSVQEKCVRWGRTIDWPLH